jgi:hypothetical protein
MNDVGLSALPTFLLRKFPPHLYIHLLFKSTAAAEENENYSDDDPPNVIISKEIAQAVIHKKYPPK